MHIFYEYPTKLETLTISGPEAKDFLHRITTVNVKALQQNQLTHGAILTATGRIRTYFRMLLEAPNQYFLFTADAKSSVTVFEQLHFREQLKIENRSAETLHHFEIAFAEKSFTLSDFATLGAQYLLPEGTQTWLSGTAEMVTALVPAAAHHDWVSNLKRLGFTSDATIEGFRIIRREPLAGHELVLDANPLEINWGSTIPENKGCYPGQEVIERIRSMGSAARALRIFRGEGPTPKTPQPIEAFHPQPQSQTERGNTPRTVAGTLTSAERDPFHPENWIGLGLVQRQFLDQTKFALGTQIIELEPNATKNASQR